MTEKINELLARLSQLPDYPVVRDLIQALWGAGEVRGAAVMVGAGFSRNLEQAAGDAPPPPVWSNFARRMAHELYPGVTGKEAGDPLRLAEEYRAALGQPALDALVRELVPDRRWRPGRLHRDLLALPWADVLTTNWDTLLERAAADMPDRAYEIVETLDDIARTRAPRIVKLHGSLPSHTPFILAEEDYRTYPRRFSPFVNLAQQVLLENDLVLVGFSGEDPNFLSWAGWVRDQLGASTRRIRLVGVLDLAPSRRRLLESQHVTPIDLAPLVAHVDPADRHRVATEVFLSALKAGRPVPMGEWRRSEDRDDPASPEALARQWSEDRRTYPGWLLAPAIDRHRIRASTLDALRTVEGRWADIDPAVRGRLAVEAAWRCLISLTDLPQWLLQAIPDLVADRQCSMERADRFALLLARLTDARRASHADAFETAAGLAAAEAETEDERAHVAHERCLLARDRLDYAGVASGLAGLAAPDPAWGLRRASMHAFLRDARKAAETIVETLLEIRSRRARDRRSVWLLSREAWAHLMADTSKFELPKETRPASDEQWPHRYAAARCDPWDTLTGFDHDIAKERERIAKWYGAAEPRFSPGARRSGATGHHWVGSGHLEPYLEISRAMDLVGFARIPMMDVVDGRLGEAASLLEETSETTWSALLEVRQSDTGLINRRFGRIAVARMEEGTAVEIARRLRAAIEYGRSRLAPQGEDEDDGGRRVAWVSRTATMIEMLSRLVMRLEAGEVADLFRWSAALTRDAGFDHWWLFKPLANLLDRCFEAVPPSKRGELGGVILGLPLPGERDLAGIDHYWPDLSWRLAQDDLQLVREEPAWGYRISSIVALARSDRLLPRTRALSLLHALFNKGVLNDAEREQAAQAIWSVPGEGGARLPGNAGIVKHAFLELPEPHTGSAEAAFRADVINRLLQGDAKAEDRFDVASAAEVTRPVSLTEAEALTAIRHLLAWRPRPGGEPDTERAYTLREENRNDAHSIALTLDRAVLPRLAERDLGNPIEEAVLDAPNTQGAELSEALPALIARRPGLGQRAFAILRRALASSDPERVYQAARAAKRWIQSVGADGSALPDGLVSELTTIVANRREPALHPALLLSARLVGLGRVRPDELDRLADALDVLEAETAYRNQKGDGLRQDTLTLVRAGCVRLAAALSKAGCSEGAVTRWLAAAAVDPVPEVRFALELDER